MWYSIKNKDNKNAGRAAPISHFVSKKGGGSKDVQGRGGTLLAVTTTIIQLRHDEAIDYGSVGFKEVGHSLTHLFSICEYDEDCLQMYK